VTHGSGRLDLDLAVVARARQLARQAGQPVVELARSHTTAAVERAVLRLAGVHGADPDGIPWVNRLVDAVGADVGLGHGVALPVWDALAREGIAAGRAGVEGADVTLLAQKAAAGSVRFTVPSGRAAAAAQRAARRAVARGLRRIDRRRAERQRLIRRYGDPKQRPWIYLIVATGDIYEDIPQAQAAARAGADVIAVIRSTGQSLLDYVPEGATREGFAGTYATQENFRLMRAALDESSRELGRYVRLTNYASGLCMPEIATLAGLERLDMMLNDSMYGILFRDINPIRTFVDQRLSRQIHARAGIIINTGEDNYLTTADAVEAAHTVTVSQLLNEFFAREAGLADWQLGLGHAFEINPDLPESFRLELAHALLARELFPDAPLKWMPPTKHMTGDVFRGNLLDGFFNLVGTLTGQSILLVGMMTEAVVTPWLSDRDIALQNVRYVLGAAGGLHEDFWPAPGGFIQRRAHQVLREAVELLERIVNDSDVAHHNAPLLNAIADGTFGIMKRPPTGGRGLDGVARHDHGYYNPATELLEPASSTTAEGTFQKDERGSARKLRETAPTPAREGAISRKEPSPRPPAPGSRRASRKRASA
jgi:beta-lysine 5,6-aminomutase alpha subunit